MRRAAVVLSFLAALAFPSALLAHEGEEHKIVGTVTIVHADKVGHIEVKTKDGENVTLTVDDQTKYLKGKASASLKDVTVGSRLVAKVTKEGKTTRASEILLGEGGAPPPPATQAPHQHQH